MSELEERALPIPPDLVEQEINPYMQELIRVWWDGQQPRSLVRPAFDDPRMVGAMLAELSHYFAQGYAQKDGRDAEEVLTDIRGRWDEIHNTGVMKGLLGQGPANGESKA